MHSMTNGSNTISAEIKEKPACIRTRRELGSYYTPHHLANSIARESLNAWITKIRENDSKGPIKFNTLSNNEKKFFSRNIRDARILDPSVGDGAFLLAAADWLDKMQVDLGDNRCSEIRRKQIVESSLYGVDISNEAVECCRKKLADWCLNAIEPNQELCDKIKQGNSLVGSVSSKDRGLRIRYSFNWFEEYPEVMKRTNAGFDIILGNPPYGNILSNEERKYIESEYPFLVGKNRNGTWNSAAHFIVRAKMLLRKRGELALLIPNSILRVNQFKKTRDFLLDELRLWKITDEGSPFDDVTLEMVSVFCEATEPKAGGSISIESRRPMHKVFNEVTRGLLKTCKVFPIYYDELYSKILNRGIRNSMTASRGRDIPRSHIAKESISHYTIPYITSGRSVQRYRIEPKYQVFTDTWFLDDSQLRRSYENEILVATKNLKYPRCIIKPKGIVHGGGIVEIKPNSADENMRALGLILNSHLVRYICTRYLTNYSQLTTCLNTGILEDLPIAVPKYDKAYEILFNAMSLLHLDMSKNRVCREVLEQLSDALVYDLYLGSDDIFQKSVSALIEKLPNKRPMHLCGIMENEEIIDAIKSIQKLPDVCKIEYELGKK